MAKKILITVILTTVGFLTYRGFLNPTQVYPYPYSFDSPVSKLQLRRAINANILIVGDRGGQSLTPFIGTLSELTSKNLKNPLQIYNWSQEGEGLHRTIQKIESLKTLPPLIIYYGSSQEFFEDKISPKDFEKFKSNLKIFRQDIMQSLLISIPILSKFFYFPYASKPLGSKPTQTTTKLSVQKQQVRLELNYALFKREFNQLVRKIRLERSTLITIIPPINYDIPPKRVCENTHSEEIEYQLENAASYLKERNFKGALNLLKNVTRENLGNAKAHYLTGQTYKFMGDLPSAKEELKKAVAFDCDPSRANPVFNSILLKALLKQDFSFVDFDTELNSLYTKNILFFDDNTPQNIYLEKLIKALSKRIVKVLDL